MRTGLACETCGAGTRAPSVLERATAAASSGAAAWYLRHGCGGSAWISLAVGEVLGP